MPWVELDLQEINSLGYKLKMSDFWDKNYSTNDYIYGREPNDFLRGSVESLSPGSALCIGEGEGRNAVFLAKLGFDVTAVDSSFNGIKKVTRLSKEQGVHVRTIHADLADFDMGINKWQYIVSIFHLPPSLRVKVHRNICLGLRTDGLLLLEGYTPKQLRLKSGGPSDMDMLYSKPMLNKDFNSLEIIKLDELERPVVEGTKHTGLGAVVQLIARRN